MGPPGQEVQDRARGAWGARRGCVERKLHVAERLVGLLVAELPVACISSRTTPTPGREAAPQVSRRRPPARDQKQTCVASTRASQPAAACRLSVAFRGLRAACRVPRVAASVGRSRLSGLAGPQRRRRPPCAEHPRTASVRPVRAGPVRTGTASCRCCSDRRLLLGGRLGPVSRPRAPGSERDCRRPAGHP